MMNKKILYLTLSLIVALCTLTVTYAAFTISSPPLTVVVSALGLTINGPLTGGANDTLVFSGTLTGPTTLTGVTVNLYAGTTIVNSTTTTAGGAYSVSWTPAIAGTYVVRAEAIKP